jgi:hypothetical protein
MESSDALTYIPELDCLDLIEDLEHDYLDAFGSRPINVSHWDPSDSFTKALTVFLDLPIEWSAVNYMFSYTTGTSIGASEGIAAAFGYDEAASGALITPSGTVSIVCAVNWIAAMGFKKLNVLFPAYFSLIHICERCGIEVIPHYMPRLSDSFSIPDITASTPGVVWISNPTYSTGVYYPDTEIEKIRALLELGWYVVADECLALSGLELGRKLSAYPRFIGIYAPHKAICVNAVKFSALCFDIRFQRFFNHWADVLYGCLGLSTRAGVAHYLSDKFQQYQSRFLERLSSPRHFIAGICQSTSAASLDVNSIGHFATCYFLTLPALLGDDGIFLKRTINASGASFIPGNRNHFDPTFGFNFRINFGQDSTMFRGAICRLIDFLTIQAPPRQGSDTNGRVPGVERPIEFL